MDHGMHPMDHGMHPMYPDVHHGCYPDVHPGWYPDVHHLGMYRAYTPPGYVPGIYTTLVYTYPTPPWVYLTTGLAVPWTTVLQWCNGDTLLGSRQEKPMGESLSASLRTQRCESW